MSNATVYTVEKLKVLDLLTNACTAFRTWHELTAACEVDGYVPTLPSTGRKGHDNAQLANELKAAGFRAWCPMLGNY